MLAPRTHVRWVTFTPRPTFPSVPSFSTAPNQTISPPVGRPLGPADKLKKC